MKKKRKMILLAQIILVILSVLLLVNYTNKRVQLTNVYVYSRDISDPSDKVTEDDVKKVSIPAKAITKDFALDKKDIIGKRVDTKVKAGQYIYKSQLVKLNEIDPFRTMNLNKYRKISLPISFVDGFAGNIKRGDKIDLVYTGEGLKMDEDGLGDKEYKYSKVFLQDILVYSVNTDDGFKFVDRSQHTQNALKEDSKEEEIDKSKIATITLAVTLEQAEEIEARTNTGLVRFLGRFNESKNYKTLGYALGDYDKIYSGPGYGEAENNAKELDRNIKKKEEEKKEIDKTEKAKIEEDMEVLEDIKN